MGYAKVEKLPIDRKKLLTVMEAVAYSGIGRDKLLTLIKQSGEAFAVHNGKKLMINRTKFDNYIDDHMYL